MAAQSDKIKSIIHDCPNRRLYLSKEPIPVPTSSQYLIQVHAVGITKGELEWSEPHELPPGTAVPGFDVAGVVLKAPSVQSKYQPGDRVYASTAAGRPANAREVSIIDESEIAGIPEGLDFVQAAAVPMSAMTAAETLFIRGGLTFGAAIPANNARSVLIIGASGAVGIWATQLAKYAGVGRIVGVCGPRNVNFVKDLGADVVIDYSEQSIGEWLVNHGNNGKFDVVLDGVGGHMLADAWRATTTNGRLFSIVQPSEDSKPSDGVSEGVSGEFFIFKNLGEELVKIEELIEQGHVEPVVDSVYAFEDFQQAFDRVETGRARGKVILNVSA
jgi:NADPH:quinone reductase-like Zn-dependent oxidoreductase